jgi:hypothetical protein
MIIPLHFGAFQPKRAMKKSSNLPSVALFENEISAWMLEISHVINSLIVNHLSYELKRAYTQMIFGSFAKISSLD